MKYGPVSYIIIGKRGESVTVETIIRPIAHIKSDFTDKFGIPRQSGLVPELTAERRKSAEQRAKLTVLEERYKRAEKLLKRLPLELTERVEDKEKSQER